MKKIIIFLLLLFILSCKAKSEKQEPTKIFIQKINLVDTISFKVDTTFNQNGFTFRVWLGTTEKNLHKFILEKLNNSIDTILLEESLYNQQYLLNDYNNDNLVDIEFPTRQFRPSKYYIFNPTNNSYIDNGKWMSFWKKIDTNLYFNYLDEELKDCEDLHSTLFVFDNYQITPVGEIEVKSLPFDSCESGLTVQQATVRKINKLTHQTIWTNLIDKTITDSFSDKENKTFKHIEFFNLIWNTNKKKIEAK